MSAGRATASPPSRLLGDAGGVGGLLAVLGAPNATPTSVFVPAYDANGHQKSAKPKPAAQGGRDFKAVRMHGARSGIPRHSGNCHVTEYVNIVGFTAAHYEYDAFGNTTAQSGSKADEFKFRFSTKYYDKETGLVHFQLRPYAPKFHSFISTDPIEERGGLNLYGFCANDPINKWDYLGMAYFAKRRLEMSWWWNIPAAILFLGPRYNCLNIEGSHEQLFFEDGKTPSNLGFFAQDDRRKLPEGVRSDTEELLKGYWKTGDSGYNDCVMRKAVDYTHTQPYSLLGRGYALGSLFGPEPTFGPFLYSECDPIKFNCQDWASAVRKNYRKFYRDPKVRKECCIKSTFLPEGRDFIIWDTY